MKDIKPEIIYFFLFRHNVLFKEFRVNLFYSLINSSISNIKIFYFLFFFFYIKDIDSLILLLAIKINFIFKKVVVCLII